MARLARHRLAPKCLEPGTLYHITNRGADRRDIFRSDLDRLVFLSMLALACLDDGLQVHAYCLMSNHFHLLIEDSRGMISRMMLRLQSSYARYFNDARGRRGSGHVFGDRFFCEVVDSPRYYDELASYILLNPLRCQVPLAKDAELYPWSSAAMSLSDLPASEFFARFVAKYGAVDSLIGAMPKLSTVECERRRRKRFEGLLAGAWIAPSAIRCGRTPDQLRETLATRVGQAKPVPFDIDQGARDLESLAATTTEATCSVDTVPRVMPDYRGQPVELVSEVIRGEAAMCLPITHPIRNEVVCYAMWRFSSGQLEAIAHALKTKIDQVTSAVENVRSRLRTDQAWLQLLWRLEWRLRWRLGAAPWRL